MSVMSIPAATAIAAAAQVFDARLDEALNPETAPGRRIELLDQIIATEAYRTFALHPRLRHQVQNRFGSDAFAAPGFADQCQNLSGKQ